MSSEDLDLPIDRAALLLQQADRSLTRGEARLLESQALREVVLAVQTIYGSKPLINVCDWPLKCSDVF